MSVAVALIAAVGRNGVIGSDNQLPWRLPTDFAFFKRMTMGKPLVMGRKTFESIGKPLAGRTTIVVSRQPDYRPEGVEVCAGIAAAIERGREVAEAAGVGEVMVAGGAEIYRQAIAGADRLYITHVEANPSGDAVFPGLDENVWRVAGDLDIVPGPKDSAGFRIRVYERRAG